MITDAGMEAYRGEYIVIWKDAPGQQISTLVDANDNPVIRDASYLIANDIATVTNEAALMSVLDATDGRKIAISTTLARSTLGWDV